MQSERLHRRAGIESSPRSCPMLAEPGLLGEVKEDYAADVSLHQIALESARTEAAGYGRATRVEEIMDFARRMGWHRLGIAHCVGLMQEAEAARDIFLAGGFEVYTVCCKVGSIDKEDMGIRDEEKVWPGRSRGHVQPGGTGRPSGPEPGRSSMSSLACASGTTACSSCTPKCLPLCSW